jgi:hypothetical protein
VPDFLRTSLVGNTPVHWLDVVIRLVTAAILGFGVTWLYRVTRPKAHVTNSFAVTLVLLSVLIAMVTQIIGQNVALAFSLVGALSIVRFRTVVRDTEDTAFVIFSVVIGMAVGTQNLVVALTGCVIVGATVFLMKPKRVLRTLDEAQYLVTIRVGLGHDVEPLVGTVLDAHMKRRHLVSMGTVKQGLSVEVAYSGSVSDDRQPESLVKALNRLEGVQGVDLARQAPTAASDPWW